jgi:Kef-type K+ transport system membrane component KefB/mannitol/fructose-specific phosphotransferase system IIA component (Ntr-type)
MTVTLAAGALGSMDITQLFLGLAVLLASARILGELCRLFNQPSVIGEIAAGVVLGPTLLGGIFPNAHAWLFPAAADSSARIALSGFTTIGVALLLMVAGMEVDVRAVIRQGKSALSISLAGIVFPLIIGVVAGALFHNHLGMGEKAEALTFSLFLGIALSITAMPVIAKTLLDLNLFRTEMGALIMSAAMVDDLIGWMGFAIVLALMSGAEGTGGGAGGDPHTLADFLGRAVSPLMPPAWALSAGVAGTIVLTVLFSALMMTGGRWFFHKILPHVQAHLSWPGGVIGFVFVVTFTCAALTEFLGIHAIFGAFFAGVALGDSPHLRERTREVIHQFITYIFAPVFFATIGLRLNFFDNFNALIVFFVLVVAIISKVAGCYWGARKAGLSREHSLGIGFGMSARGAMEIILGQIAFSHGLINEEMLIALIIMALVTSLMAGPIMQRMIGKKPTRRFSDLLAEKQFVPAMTSRTARQAIEEMAKCLGSVTLPAGITKEQVIETVWARETLLHTGLPGQVAIPHAKLQNLDRPLIMLGRNMEGIDFQASDGQPARLIIMILTPAHDPSLQVELLAQIARLFSQKEMREKTLECRTYTEVLAMFRVAESQSAGH